MKVWLRRAIQGLIPVVAVSGVLVASYFAPVKFNTLVGITCSYTSPTPTVTSVSPTSGTTSGGTTVTINGAGFCNGLSSVHFGATAATGLNLVTNNQITAVSPAHVAGTVDVTVTTAGGTSATSVADRYTYQVTPCTSVGVSAAPPSPQMKGTAVDVTATAGGCPNPNFEFWVKAPGATLYTKKQDYSSSATFHWVTTGLPSGTYQFSVWARDESSTGTHINASGTYDAFNASFTYTLSQGCASVGVSVSPPSPVMEGTHITVTATGSGCPNPLYEFWVLAPGASLYVLGQGYSSDASWDTDTGLPLGTYRFSVWVKDASSPGTFGNASGRYDAYNANVTYTLTAGCTRVSSVSFNPTSPQASGTPVDITATSDSCPSPNFEFWVKAPGATSYTLARGYGAGTFTWVTTGKAPGVYQFSVWVEDDSSSGTFGNASGRYDAFDANHTYTLTVGG